MNYFKAKFFKSCYLREQLFESKKKEVVFVGRSNVGKSSIINKIFNRKHLARTSNVPGKTASINFYDVEDLYFVDFPGYGFSKIAKFKKKLWENLAEDYFSSNRRIALAILVIDIRRGIQDLDFEMIKYLVYRKLYFIVILNKIDKLKKKEIEENTNKVKTDLSFLRNIKIILFSTKTGTGVEELKNLLETFV